MSSEPPDASPKTSRHSGQQKLPSTVVGLGLVSLLTDTSSEAIFPLLPAFLATLGASNALIGLIEGVAELVANLAGGALAAIVVWQALRDRAENSVADQTKR